MDNNDMFFMRPEVAAMALARVGVLDSDSEDRDSEWWWYDEQDKAHRRFPCTRCGRKIDADDDDCEQDQEGFVCGACADICVEEREWRRQRAII